MTSPLTPLANPYFTGWQDLGSVTITPDTTDVAVGVFTMQEGDTHIWVRMQSFSSSQWPWSYGILGFKTSQGYELGSVKAYSETDGEVFRLGTGLSPTELTGVITFEPRSFNLAWIKKGNPWTLGFQAQSGSLASSGPAFGMALNTFVDSSNNGLSLLRVDFT